MKIEAVSYAASSSAMRFLYSRFVDANSLSKVSRNRNEFSRWFESELKLVKIAIQMLDGDLMIRTHYRPLSRFFVYFFLGTAAQWLPGSCFSSTQSFDEPESRIAHCQKNECVDAVASVAGDCSCQE
jgi:hypothetical protein